MNGQLDQVISSKRRRIDQDYSAFVAPSTSRTAAKAAANGRAAEAARTAQLKKDDNVHIPLLDLATLPPASLQRYLSRYGLLEPHGSLSYRHAVFPVPPLPAHLIPPLTGRGLNKTRSKPAHTLRSYEDDGEVGGGRRARPHHGNRSGSGGSGSGSGTETGLKHNGGANGATTNGRSNGAGREKKRVWQEPKMQEFAELSAYDDPQLVVDRLAARAKEHWDKKDSVKEGETLTNFIFALRMRAHTLRATPPG
ncbi:hypothetical protein P7C70_g53, partial [Phenoliferia sp. Uapishka_3]